MTSPTPLFLICHKVRGERAYDVALRMDCPCCERTYEDVFACDECDSLGYWWIIPTSGHRAHPVLYYPLSELLHSPDEARVLGSVTDHTVPDLFSVEDHYQVAFAPGHATVDARPEFLRALLRKPQVVVNRRGL